MTERSRWPAFLVLGAVLLVGALSNRDLLSGTARPCFRDIGTTQAPSRALYAALGPAATNPFASFGQTYYGNPNLVLAHPFPKNPRGLGLHLLLHLGLGLVGAWVFFRRIVREEEAAVLGALAYGLSGYVLSSAAFLNATTTLAFLPWLLAATFDARRAGRPRFLVSVVGIALASMLLVAGGEPALGLVAILLAGAIAASAPHGTRARSLAALVMGGLIGAVASAPWLLEVWRASAISSRRLRGFSWREFAAVGFHPLRLLETPFPHLFGDPTRVVSGGYWGFAVTQGNPPYLPHLGFGVLPLALAAVFVISARRVEGRLFIGIAGLSLALSLTPWLPGARAVYEALPFLHALRYPVKAMLPFTFALAALAALGADRLLVEGALPRFRRRAAYALVGLAALFGAACVFARTNPATIEELLRRGWDSSWASDPHVVLAPVVRRLPAQAAIATAALLVLASLLLRGAADARGRFLLLAAAATELLVGAQRLLPRAPSVWYETTYPLVAKARSIPGRVFERAGKDFDAVRRGLFGRLAADDVTALVYAQQRQGWALAGAPHGLRYAYDPDPDGSYTLLNRMANDLLSQRSWAGKRKWLRAAGVGSVIASDLPPGTLGYAPVAVETEAGVPVTLFALEDPLSGVRRLSRVFASSSPQEAVARFERDDFDPRTDGVVSGASPLAAVTTVDVAATARVVAETADAMAIETNGTAPGLLHVDRSYTPRLTARVNGASVRPVALDLHLTGIPVPSGAARVDVDFAP